MFRALDCKVFGHSSLGILRINLILTNVFRINDTKK